MRWRYIAYIIGSLVLFLGLTMLVPLLGAVYYHETEAAALIWAVALTVLCGGLLFTLFRRHRATWISQREGMAIVAFGWTAIGVCGALPFYLSSPDWLFVDALFESMSGFTTTGATILTDIECLPRGLMLWRSFTQWLGGMGIIVLSIAILPFLGVGGLQLYKAEVPTPVPDKLRPRIRDTAKLLWKVYVLFSVVQVIMLMLGGMSFFDAMCHAFTTMPSGGFSTWNKSVGHFDSVYIHTVFIIFMLITGINFSLHYQMLRGRPLAFWRDAECRFFLFTVLALALLVSWNVWGTVYDSLTAAIRHGLFQVVSIITTTGYVTVDYEQWPAMAQIILLLCMFVGASAGSTSGGMKCLRVMLCCKYCYRELFSMVHPRAVTTIKIGGRPVPDDVMRSVLGFLALYIGLFALASLLLAAMGTDYITAFGAVAAAIGNVGPGFGLVGPTENYAFMPIMGKWLLIWCMLLGRLEIFTVLILLMPEFWRR